MQSCLLSTGIYFPCGGGKIIEKTPTIIHQLLPQLFAKKRIFSVNSPTVAAQNLTPLPRRSELISDWLKFTRARVKTLRSLLFGISIKCVCVCVCGGVGGGGGVGWGGGGGGGQISGGGKELTEKFPKNFCCSEVSVEKNQMKEFHIKYLA